MDLNAGWRMQHLDPGSGDEAGAFHPDFDDRAWVPAVVPGDVHTSLLAAGAIPDIFYDRNLETVQWIEDREWWFRATFQAPSRPDGPDERDLLTLDGLDVYATVYLNGEGLGSHANMFRPATFDVTNRLSYGAPNLIAVRFDPVRQVVRGREVPGQWAPYGAERALVRKAQYQFSWDWAPRLVNVGIWQGVRLERFRTARLLWPFLTTLTARPNHAVVLAGSDVEVWGDSAGLELDIRLHRPRAAFGTTTEVRGGHAETALTVLDPELWWPQGYGAQGLYDLEMHLRRDDEVIDSWRDRVGLRTVRLDRTPDPDEVGAENFTFVINGVPVFVKGTNWIPADSLNGRVDRVRYEALMRPLVEANGNMLRVWGGGQYEKDDFYHLADELGILIWQDFMFACARYPDGDQEFVAEVRAEAEYQVRRLRNRACLAIWVGNNENDSTEDIINWDAPGHDFPGKSLCHHHLREIVARLDPTRPYWPSSPYGGNDHNGEQSGDRHNWHVWHGGVLPRRFGERPGHDPSPAGVSYRHYLDDTARFVSEFGMHASPVIESLRRNVPEEALHLGSESVVFRNKDEPKNKGDALMHAHTGLPRDLRQYVDFSMLCQAEGLKVGIEHYRRRKFRCSGTLFWQWNDCWPGISWSVLDYYGFAKAAYFFVKRAYAPVLASFVDDREGGVSIWVTNDLLSSIEESLEWTYATFDGEVLDADVVAARVPPNESHQVARIPVDRLVGDPRSTFLWVKGRDGLVPDNRHFFAEIKDLIRDRPQLSVVWDEINNGLIGTLKTDRYAYFVRLFVPVEGVRYSDNWLDIPAGERRTVKLSGPGGGRLDSSLVEVDWL
jgi:beta-mannosidase